MEIARATVQPKRRRVSAVQIFQERSAAFKTFAPFVPFARKSSLKLSSPTAMVVGQNSTFSKNAERIEDLAAPFRTTRTSSRLNRGWVRTRNTGRVFG
jgi:hypothetical protein